MDNPLFRELEEYWDADDARQAEHAHRGFLFTTRLRLTVLGLAKDLSLPPMSTAEMDSFLTAVIVRTTPAFEEAAAEEWDHYLSNMRPDVVLFTHRVIQYAKRIRHTQTTVDADWTSWIDSLP